VVRTYGPGSNRSLRGWSRYDFQPYFENCADGIIRLKRLGNIPSLFYLIW
jgi:hypothetical protein